MTSHDWDDAVNKYFDPGPEPSRDDGWMTIADAMGLPFFAGKTREYVRKCLVSAWEKGDFERQTWKDRLYYRMVTSEKN